MRRLARPLGVDDDLRVREVGDGVQRDVAHRVNAAEHQRQRRQQDDELVPERKIDDALEHSNAAITGCSRRQFSSATLPSFNVLVGTSFMPHLGHSPGLSETTSRVPSGRCKGRPAADGFCPWRQRAWIPPPRKFRAVPSPESASCRSAGICPACPHARRCARASDRCSTAPCRRAEALRARSWVTGTSVMPQMRAFARVIVFDGDVLGHRADADRPFRPRALPRAAGRRQVDAGARACPAVSGAGSGLEPSSGSPRATGFPNRA